MGTWCTIKSLWKEGGIAALYRGWYAGVPRLFIGSATQLTMFGLAADWLRSLQVSISCIAQSIRHIEAILIFPRY